jgi:hypothetical protein
MWLSTPLIVIFPRVAHKLTKAINRLDTKGLVISCTHYSLSMH